LHFEANYISKKIKGFNLPELQRKV